MKHSFAGLFFVLCVLCVAKQTECYRILAVVPMFSYSHQIPYRRLWLELHARGHEVVLATTHPIPNFESPNFTQINIAEKLKRIRPIDFVKMRFEGRTWFDFMEDQFFDLCEEFVRLVFDAPQMKKIYAPDSNAKFDVFLTELIYTPSLFAFAHRFNVPMIGLSSLGVCAINEHVLGGLVLPTHESTWEVESRTSQSRSFTTRLTNFLSMWRMLYIFHRDIFPLHQRIAESYLGPLPPMIEIMKNVSAFFVDQSDVLTAARPKLANIVTFTSLHIVKNPDPLPKDLQEFVDTADTGFIYFSMGSNVKSADFPVETRRMICDVLSNLPYKVVWKFEEDLVEKPANVYVNKWFTQQTVLAHPKIKLFITQGGVQSTEEAIHFAVPVIVIPIMSDQDYQASRVEALGIGKRLEITTLTRNEFDSAVREVITNKKYKESMLRFRNLTKDTPYDMVKNLVWWTEYVIRTNGAPHLRSSLARQPWYQYCDMDIVVFLVIVALLIISITLSQIIKIIVYIYKTWQPTTHRKQKIS